MSPLFFFSSILYIVLSQQQVDLQAVKSTSKPVSTRTPTSKPVSKAPTSKIPTAKFPSAKPVSSGGPFYDNWCGKDGKLAGDCHKPCFTGQSSECGAGEYCWAGIKQCTSTVPTSLPSFRPTTKPSSAPTIKPNNNYCGKDSTASGAGDCHKPCPFGQASECPAGEQCWAGIINCPATNGAK